MFEKTSMILNLNTTLSWLWSVSIVFVLTRLCCLIITEAADDIFMAFGCTLSRTQPTIFYIWVDHTKFYTTETFFYYIKKLFFNIKVYFVKTQKIYHFTKLKMHVAQTYRKSKKTCLTFGQAI
jgi:hypothetical protein